MKNKIIFALGIFLFVFVIMTPSVKAANNVIGWAGGWSQDMMGVFSGLGWISTNSTNQGGATAYGLNIPSDNTDVTGYAWSENVGWISFQPSDLVGCPSSSCSARRVNDTVEGWARIVSIKTASLAGNAGGWSGWIKLHSNSTDPVQYGITLPASGNGALGGYAWSDELGWISFSKASMSTPGCGAATRTYVYTETGYGASPEFCTNGTTPTPSSPSFPAEGSSVGWGCGTKVCTASRQACSNNTCADAITWFPGCDGLCNGGAGHKTGTCTGNCGTSYIQQGDCTNTQPCESSPMKWTEE